MEAYNIRGFILKNSKNERINLLSKNIFGANPDGLGVSFNNVFFSAYGNYDVSKYEVPQNVITFELILGAVDGKGYSLYNTILSIFNDKLVTLEYNIPDVGTFEREVSLKDYPKSQKDENGVIRVNIELYTLTPWFVWRDVEYDNNNNNTYDGKGFLPNLYYNNVANPPQVGYKDPHYYYGSSFSVFNKFDILNESQMFNIYQNSPIYISLKADYDSGAIVNPGFAILDEKHNVVFQQTYLLTIPIGYRLEIVSSWFSPRAILTNDEEGFIPVDVSNYISLDSDGYLRAPFGKSVLILSDGLFDTIKNNISSYLQLKVKEERMAV